MAGAGVLLAAAAPAKVAGPARLVDGDTFTLGAERVRLWGVDAPEGRQVCRDANGHGYACGDAARDQLVGLINGRILRCAVRDRDPYGRAVSRCVVGSTDLGEAMVRAGWAVDSVQFSRGAYASAEAEARRARRGLWAGLFETPSAWRAAARSAPPPPATPPQTGCVIKGNLSARGRRIFHLPGQADYAATRIDTARGERWFCSPAEARAAGWTAAAR